MRQNHRAIKTMAWPFNAFPVTFTRHCSSSVAVAVYSFFKKLPFGDIWRNELDPFIIWFQQICYNKAAPCSSQLWWIAACQTKGERGLLLMRLLWSATNPRRLGVERLNALAVLFENTAKQNKKIDRLLFDIEHLRVSRYDLIWLNNFRNAWTHESVPIAHSFIIF